MFMKAGFVVTLIAALSTAIAVARPSNADLPGRVVSAGEAASLRGGCSTWTQNVVCQGCSGSCYNNTQGTKSKLVAGNGCDGSNCLYNASASCGSG
jgi:hypothetical protein